MNQSGKFFKATEDYVNNVCGAFIAPNNKWHSIDCRHKGSDGITFIRMMDTSGDCYYFDVTAFNLHQIGLLVALVVAGNRVSQEITKYYDRAEVAKLFM